MSSPSIIRLAQHTRHLSPASTARLLTTMASAADFKPRQVGAQYTTDYRVYLENTKTGQPASPFHDVPLYANEEKTVLNFIVEVSRWSNAKLEISKEEAFNPIKQDIKKGKLRFVRNVFPYHGYIWNYGAFPQTWEDPSHTHPDTQAKGDNDPLDVCEIGEAIGYPGQIKQVKVLGVMALLDEGETDWKVLVIDVNDPLAAKLNDIEDFETYLPGLVKSTNEWFRLYKIPDGKPENQFAFSGEAKNKAYANNVIKECHEAWKRLVSGEANPGEVSIANSSVEGSKGFVAAGDAAIKAVPAANPLPAASVEQAVAKNFYLKADKTIAS